MSNDTIHIDLNKEKIDEFHSKIYDLYDKSRPDKNLCSLRYHVLSFMNEVWQNYLIEKELSKYDSDNELSIEIETIKAKHSEPYKKYDDEEGNIWCTPTESDQKMFIVRECENGAIIKKQIIPSAVIFGSIACGIDAKASDIDIALPAGIKDEPVRSNIEQSFQQKLLRHFIRHLQLKMGDAKKYGYSFRIEPILFARVPIVKLVETSLTSGKLLIDIGIKSTQMPITNLISFYCEYDDRVRLFLSMVKVWAKRRQISDAMHGFPNSFGFVMLCTKFLQLTDKPVLPIMKYNRKTNKLYHKYDVNENKLNQLTLIELLTQFFDFWWRFDFEAYQININTPGLEWKHAQDYNLNHSEQSTMLVEDPLSPNENVTRVVKKYNLKILKYEFFCAYKATKHADWTLLMQPFNKNNEIINIFDVYPPSDEDECIFQDEFEEEYEWNQQYDDIEKKNKNKNKHKKLYKTKQKQKNQKKYIKKKQNFIANTQKNKYYF